MGLQSRLVQAVALILLLCAAGCMRRDGRNSDCRWPGEQSAAAVDAAHLDSHLSADAEFAEDLAIRYADVHHGLRTPNFVSGEDYENARDRCRDALFQAVAKEHGVPVERVSSALGKNRLGADIAINLPFVLIYCFGAIVAARVIWKKYPVSDNGWMPGTIMILFVSLVFAIGGGLAGEVWAWIIETWRVGNGHMSHRVTRLPWHAHRLAFFLGGVVMFWLMAVAARNKQPLIAPRS